MTELVSFASSDFWVQSVPSWFDLVPSLAEAYHRFQLRFPELQSLLSIFAGSSSAQRIHTFALLPLVSLGVVAFLLVYRFGKDEGDHQLEYLERVERLRRTGIKVRGQVRSVREFARAVCPEDLNRDVSHHFFFMCSWKHPETGEVISFRSEMLHGEPNTRSLFRQGVLLLVNPEVPQEYLINQAHKSWS